MDINFIKQDAWQKTSLGRFLKWALTYGRYIVIFTELIVILAFLSRFKFDRDLTDLKEEVQNKTVVINSASALEQDFRLLKEKIGFLQTVDVEALASNDVFKKLASALPSEVAISKLDCTYDKLSFEATSVSENGLATLLYSLKKTQFFKNIDLKNVTSDPERQSGLSFEVLLEIDRGQTEEN